jgi:hypothetical protein
MKHLFSAFTAESTSLSPRILATSTNPRNLQATAKACFLSLSIWSPLDPSLSLDDYTGPIIGVVRGQDDMRTVPIIPSARNTGFESNQDTFRNLVAEWLDDTLFSSDLSEILASAPFRRIVGLGSPAIPLILRELKKQPSLLVFALQEISKQNPVPPQCRGNITEMTSAWLAWGESY